MSIKSLQGRRACLLNTTVLSQTDLTCLEDHRVDQHFIIIIFFVYYYYYYFVYTVHCHK